MRAELLALMITGALLVAGRVGGLHAQRASFTPPAQPATGYVPITLVLVGDDARPGVLRRASVAPQNVILLESSTITEQLLSDAVLGLLIMQAGDPSGARRRDDQLSYPRLHEAAPVFPWAGEALTRLRAAAATPVPGLGRVKGPSLQIWVAALGGHPPRQEEPEARRTEPLEETVALMPGVQVSQARPGFPKWP